MIIFVFLKKAICEEMINIVASILQQCFASGGIRYQLNVCIDEKAVFTNGSWQTTARGRQSLFGLCNPKQEWSGIVATPMGKKKLKLL